MRMSQLFFQTLREAPSEARTPGFQFLVRAGLVRSLGGGYAILPLGIKTRQKIEAVICDALRVGRRAACFGSPCPLRRTGRGRVVRI